MAINGSVCEEVPPRTPSSCTRARRSAASLTSNIRQAYGRAVKLRILLYQSRLAATDAATIRQDDAGIIWLGKSEA